MPLRSVSAVLRRVDEQLEELRRTVFDQPPSDWSGFQKMLGQYQALTVLREEVIREEEEEP